MGKLISWQAEVVIALMVVGGGYFAYINKFAPFNSGGLFDSLKKYLPKADSGESAAADDGSDTSTDTSNGNPMLPMPTSPIPNPPGPNPFPPGMFPSQPFQATRSAAPTPQDETVYENYAKALNFLYGQGNQANVGANPNVPMVTGDPNLGTTPVPGNLFAPQSPMGMQSPTGMPIYPNSPASGYPPQMMQQQQQLQFPGPTRLPIQPFLPSPMQYPGPVQPGPYPSAPPRLPMQPPFQAPPLSPTDLLGLDLGRFHIAFRGIRIKDLLDYGIPPQIIFVHGFNPSDQRGMMGDIEAYVNTLLSRINNTRTGSLIDIIKSEAKRWKKLLKRSNAAFVVPSYVKGKKDTNSMPPYLKRLPHSRIKYKPTLGRQ